MGISDISAAAGAAASLTTKDTVGIAVLKKALQVTSQSALQLINNIPSPGPRVDADARLGQSIDVRA